MKTNLRDVNPRCLERGGGSSLLPRGEKGPFSNAQSVGPGEKRQKRNFKLSKKINKGMCTRKSTKPEEQSCISRL